MKNEMRESYLALKKIAKEEFFGPLRASVQRMMKEHKEILAKYEEPATGPTVKDEMRESYFEIKKVADDVIGKPARVLREMIATQSTDMKAIYAKFDTETPATASGQKGGDKPAPGGASGAAP